MDRVNTGRTSRESVLGRAVRKRPSKARAASARRFTSASASSIAECARNSSIVSAGGLLGQVRADQVFRRSSAGSVDRSAMRAGNVGIPSRGRCRGSCGHIRRDVDDVVGRWKMMPISSHEFPQDFRVVTSAPATIPPKSADVAINEPVLSATTFR